MTGWKRPGTHDFGCLGDCVVGDRYLHVHGDTICEQPCHGQEAAPDLTDVLLISLYHSTGHLQLAAKPQAAAGLLPPIAHAMYSWPDIQGPPLTRGIGRKHSCRPLKLACLQPSACGAPHDRRAAMTGTGIGCTGWHSCPDWRRSNASQPVGKLVWLLCVEFGCQQGCVLAIRNSFARRLLPPQRYQTKGFNGRGSRMHQQLLPCVSRGQIIADARKV